MRAVLTQDLFNDRADKLVITTCADGLFCIPKITEFIHHHGFRAPPPAKPRLCDCSWNEIQLIISTKFAILRAGAICAASSLFEEALIDG